MPNSDISAFNATAVSIPSVSRITFIEVLEKVLISVFFIYFAINIWEHIDYGRIANLMLLLSEALTAGLVILHRPAHKVSTDIGHWLMAISVSFLPVSFVPATENAVVPMAISSALMLFGFLLSLVSKLCLSRSFGIVPANRGVRRSGPYSLVRHPIYAGYFCSYGGFLIAAPYVWNLMVSGLIGALLVRRIMAEEGILNQDPCYRAYAGEVRDRLLPGVF